MPGDRPQSPVTEITPGVWEYAGPHAPMAVIRFLRHKGELCYRATKWRADGDEGDLIGYFSRLEEALLHVTSSVEAYFRRERGESGPPSAGQASVIAPNRW